jgi:cytochrome c biogenesis protein CcdA
MKKYYKVLALILILIIAIFILKDDIVSGKLIMSKLRNSDDVNFIIILIAGIVDGINPCALSMLLFFITFTAANDSKNTNILLIGTMFAIGTFTAYFLSGIGLLKVIRLGKYITNFHIVIYSFTAILALILAYLNIKDAINAKKYNIGDIKLQLPSKNKEFIHNLIKRLTQYKLKYLVSLILGFLVTLSELLCTGQVYLTTMIAIYKFDSITRILYLTVFNIGFIFPILIISVLIYKGREVMDMTDVLFTKLWIIKVITAIIMSIFAIISVTNLLSII